MRRVHDFGADAFKLRMGKSGHPMELGFAKSGLSTGIFTHRAHGKWKATESASAFDQAFSYYEQAGRRAHILVDVIEKECSWVNGSGSHPPCSVDWTTTARYLGRRGKQGAARR